MTAKKVRKIAKGDHVDADSERGPRPISWTKSVQIVTALGLPFGSIVSAAHFFKLDEKLGLNFDADQLTSVIYILVFIGLTMYYPIHAATVWIKKRIQAGNDPKSDAAKISTPAIVTTTIATAKRLTR
jgi:hypothetical protein